jgi:hypothetical protein
VAPRTKASISRAVELLPVALARDHMLGKKRGCPCHASLRGEGAGGTPNHFFLAEDRAGHLERARVSFAMADSAPFGGLGRLLLVERRLQLELLDAQLARDDRLART